MMETILENRNQTVIRTEEMAGGKLIYHLLETKLEADFEEMDVPGPVFTYGVEIISNLTGKEERSRYEDISPNVREAAGFYEALIRNVVLPESLEDIVTDYLNS